MCSMYWNLITKMKCPECGKITLWNLQTHFMGSVGSYINNYKLGDKVPELKGVSITLNDKIDDFNGDCENCGKFFDVGAKIIDGRVEEVFVIKEWQLNSK